jgi:hypothetical protein
MDKTLRDLEATGKTYEFKRYGKDLLIIKEVKP